MKLKELSELEKIALLWASTLETPPDWRQLYNISHPARAVENTDKSIISKWKHSQRVANFYTDARRGFLARLEEIREEGRKEERRKGGKEERGAKNGGGAGSVSGVVDYTDRAQVLQYLNEVVNTTRDERQRFDALKMLADLQQFKNGGGENTEIQRFYTPLSCQNCKLYQDQREK